MRIQEAERVLFRVNALPLDANVLAATCNHLPLPFLGPFVTRIRAEIPHSHRVVRICLLVKYCKTVLGIHSLSFGLQMQKLSQKCLGCLCRVMFIAIFVENGVRMCGAIDAEDALRTLFNSLLLYQPAPLDAFAPRRSSASDNGR